MESIRVYDRTAAVNYAHRWAYSYNPRYYDYQLLGGDCTNFASQCLYAGTGIMNDTPTFGWYYFDPNNKAPAWTGVEFFYNFITRGERSPGPFGAVLPPDRADLLLPGDFVQMQFQMDRFSHTAIVVQVRYGQILLAAHSQDADFRPLNTYSFRGLRLLHIMGAYPKI